MHARNRILPRRRFQHPPYPVGTRFAVTVGQRLLLLVKLHGPLVAAAVYPAHHHHKLPPIARIRRLRRAVQIVFMTQSRLRQLQAAQLPPHTDGRPAHLLKLADAPQRRPSQHPLRRLHHIAAVRLVIAAYTLAKRVFAVDVLTDILGDIARRTAPAFIDALEMHPRLYLDKLRRLRALPKLLFRLKSGGNLFQLRRLPAARQCCIAYLPRLRHFRRRRCHIAQTQFLPVLAAAVQRHDFAEAPALLRRHKKQAMPVRTAVMVRLCHAEAVDFDALFRQRRTNARPHPLQIGRRIARRRTVIFRIPLARCLHRRMKTARAGQRDKFAHMPQIVGHRLKSCNPHHQPRIAQPRIRFRFFHQFGERELLSQLVHHHHCFEQSPVARTPAAPCGHRLIAHIQSGALMHAVETRTQQIFPLAAETLCHLPRHKMLIAQPRRYRLRPVLLRPGKARHIHPLRRRPRTQLFHPCRIGGLPVRSRSQRVKSHPTGFFLHHPEHAQQTAVFVKIRLTLHPRRCPDIAVVGIDVQFVRPARCWTNCFHQPQSRLIRPRILRITAQMLRTTAAVRPFQPFAAELRRQPEGQAAQSLLRHKRRRSPAQRLRIEIGRAAETLGTHFKRLPVQRRTKRRKSGAV